MACPPDRSHRALAATPPRRSRAPRPPRPGRDPHPSSLFGLVPPASPSETAPRVYTRDGLSAGGEASMPCQRAKRVDGEGRCRKPRTVCTRGRDFLASAGLHWGILPKTASRVYTRDALSGKDWPQLPINRGNVTTGQDHVRSLVLCVHAGRGFCRWEERHPAPLSFSPSWIFSAS
jgi:hypothetical protein